MLSELIQVDGTESAPAAELVSSEDAATFLANENTQLSPKAAPRNGGRGGGGVRAAFQQFLRQHISGGHRQRRYRMAIPFREGTPVQEGSASPSKALPT